MTYRAAFTTEVIHVHAHDREQPVCCRQSAHAGAHGVLRTCASDGEQQAWRRRCLFVRVIEFHIDSKVSKIINQFVTYEHTQCALAMSEMRCRYRGACSKQTKRACCIKCMHTTQELHSYEANSPIQHVSPHDGWWTLQTRHRCHHQLQKGRWESLTSNLPSALPNHKPPVNTMRCGCECVRV